MALLGHYEALDQLRRAKADSHGNWVRAGEANVKIEIMLTALKQIVANDRLQRFDSAREAQTAIDRAAEIDWSK